MNLSWQNGSQLYIVSQSSGNSSYYYDASGARYQKLVSGVTTTYHLVDGVAYSEKRSNGIELQYLYDENGSVYGIRKNGILYYFLFNGQGDVIGIYDEYKTLQARYEYDAWGKLLSVTNASGAAITSSTHIGNVNPFRYRGYYYDVETGFYYLNSRYYDPEVKRFLTADIYVNSGSETSGFNMFTYCWNNPINMIDSNGKNPLSVIARAARDILIGAFVDAVLEVTTGRGITDWMVVIMEETSEYARKQHSEALKQGRIPSDSRPSDYGTEKNDEGVTSYNVQELELRYYSKRFGGRPDSPGYEPTIDDFIEYGLIPDGENYKLSDDGREIIWDIR